MNVTSRCTCETKRGNGEGHLPGKARDARRYSHHITQFSLSSPSVRCLFEGASRGQLLQAALSGMRRAAVIGWRGWRVLFGCGICPPGWATAASQPTSQPITRPTVGAQQCVATLAGASGNLPVARSWQAGRLAGRQAAGSSWLASGGRGDTHAEASHSPGCLSRSALPPLGKEWHPRTQASHPFLWSRARDPAHRLYRSLSQSPLVPLISSTPPVNRDL